MLDEKAALVKRLKAWRKKNGLSQRQAAEVMEARGVLVDVMTMKQWEQGRNRPGRLAGKLVGDFLERYPVITDAPVHGKRSKLRAEDVAEIRRLRAQGETLSAIAGRYGVDSAYISRLCRGKQVVKRAG
jgi:transcriptional regulator with XRE-family HTH domain